MKNFASTSKLLRKLTKSLFTLNGNNDIFLLVKRNYLLVEHPIQLFLANVKTFFHSSDQNFFKVVKKSSDYQFSEIQVLF